MQENLEKPLGRLITYKQAAEAFGLPYFKIQRAAARGLIPTYSILNGRRYVKICDIQALLEANR